MTEVRIPATSANLGVLFDKGGVALDAFENIIKIEEADEFSLDVSGLETGHIPRNKENLINKAIEYFYNETGRTMPVFSILTTNGIPISRGLGSSAACISGGIFAANLFEEEILNKKEIIMMAAGLEGHGDNVCAAVSGGFSIYKTDGILTIPSSTDLGFILYLPKETLSTKKSRGILPSEYDYKTRKMADNLEHSMMKALYDMDYEKAGSLMELDVIHQPYRKQLIPYWEEVMLFSKKAGVWGTALSGAGPAMISMCPANHIDKIIKELKMSVDKRFNLNIIGCEINTRGIRGKRI